MVVLCYQLDLIVSQLREVTMVNTKKLNTLIKDAGLRKDSIAASLHITKQSLSNKINNKTEFKMGEISELKGMLHLSPDAVMDVFFASRLDCESIFKEVANG